MSDLLHTLGVMEKTQSITGQLFTDQPLTDQGRHALAVAALVTANQHSLPASTAHHLSETAALGHLLASAPPECECMLCDLPLEESHAPVTWMLEFEFNRPPAVEFGLGSMLLCDHCLQHWVEESDQHGGTPVRYFPV